MSHLNIHSFCVLMCGMVPTVIPEQCLMLEETILGFFPMLRQTAQTFEVTAATVLTFEVITRHGGLCKNKVGKR